MGKPFFIRAIGLSIVLLLLTGCQTAGVQPSSGDSWPVYYTVDWKNGDPNRLLDSRAVSVRDSANPLPDLLDHLLRSPGDEYLFSAFPSDTQLLSYSLEAGILTLDLSDPYGALSGGTLSLADACAVLTLCRVPGVRSVRLISQGEPQAHRSDRVFTADDFLVDELTLKPVERLLTLYFISADGQTLRSEQRPVFIRESEAAERYVMEELLVGPKTAGLEPLIDFPVSLLSAVTEDNICHVNLPSEFYETPPLASAALTLEAIVNSLTNLAGVDAVQFWQDGDIPKLYGGQALDKPLIRQSLNIQP